MLGLAPAVVFMAFDPPKSHKQVFGLKNTSSRLDIARAKTSPQDTPNTYPKHTPNIPPKHPPSMPKTRQRYVGICKKKHVKYLTKYYKFTDCIYFGIINGLKNTGHYQLANIIVLVILLPLLIWVFIIKSLNVQDQINKLKN